jgi:hypothetical protein
MNNIVSKILIVANLVFSLCFMCFAGAVYSFQAGWHEKATKTATQLVNANGQIADLQGQKIGPTMPKPKSPDRSRICSRRSAI